MTAKDDAGIMTGGDAGPDGCDILRKFSHSFLGVTLFHVCSMQHSFKAENVASGRKFFLLCSPSSLSQK